MDILGPWVNRTWQNAVAFTIIGVLIVLSMILVVSTLFTSINGVLLSVAGGAVLVVGGPLLLRSRRRRIATGGSSDRLADIRQLDRNTRRMPPLDQLPKPVMSPVRKAGLLILRGYLMASVLLISMKVFSSFIHPRCEPFQPAPARVDGLRHEASPACLDPARPAGGVTRKRGRMTAMGQFLATMPAVGVGYFTARAAVALLLGAAIGLERQWRQRTAGLRTNALVALGSALFELFAVLLTGQHGVDPTRIAAYVVSGIGFLGAGVILREGVTVRGINTAATIWCSAAVGVLAGAGYIPAAAIGAGLVLAAHLLLRPVARRVDRLPASPHSEVETIYTFRAVSRAADEAHIRALMVQALTREGFVLRSLRSQDLNAGSGLVEITADLQLSGRDDVALEAIVSRVSLEPSISSVTWNACEPAALATAEE
jgi:putative Mg2+ transporter-C (MgtC) family protein